jgi:hypothetical protein
MKNFPKMLIGAALFAAVMFMAACQKDAAQVGTTAYNNAAADAAKLSLLFEKQGAKTEKFTLDAEKGGEIVSEKGTKFKIPSNAFSLNQQAVTGDVTILIKEIHKVSDMVFGNKPTTTDRGQLLTSFGEFSINAEQSGKTLALATGKGILASRPFKSVNGITKSQVQNWVSTTTSPVTGAEWLLSQSNNSLNNLLRDSDNELEMLISSLSWCNWDRINENDAPNGRTTVSVMFESNFNRSTETAVNRTDIMLSAVYFKPEGSNSLYKFYERIRGANGLQVSEVYGNIVPIGMRGKLLAYSIIDGQYFVEVQDATITRDERADRCTLTVNPHATREGEFAEAIHALNE